MTIKSLVYFDKVRPEYLEIISVLRRQKSVEISHFICGQNTLVSIDGLLQIQASVPVGLQQTRCDTVIVFSCGRDIVDIVKKTASSNIHINFILFPLSVDLKSLEEISSMSHVTINTCLPLRHLSMVWKAHKRLTAPNSIFEPIQYIEAKLVSPSLRQRNLIFGTDLEWDINANNWHQLLVLDAVQFVCQRMVVKVQAVGKSIGAEIDSNINNEKHLHDYSIVIGYFRLKSIDIKKSPTSSSANSLLSPRTALIRIKNPELKSNKMNLKIKIMSNGGLFVIDKDHIEIDGEKCENIEELSGDKINPDAQSESLWSSALFLQGIERFLKHVDYARQPDTHRLVDLGTQVEEDSSVARANLISVPQLIQLCKVVCTIDRAVVTGQTTIVE